MCICTHCVIKFFAINYTFNLKNLVADYQMSIYFVLLFINAQVVRVLKKFA